MMRHPAGLAGLALLAACAQQPPPREWVVVMPSADGHAGSVVVTRGLTETVLTGPYSAVRSGSTQVERADPKEIETVFAPALAATPMRPVAFTLFFESDTDELTADSRAQFERIIAEIARFPVPRITVIGHADTTGTYEHNDALSLRRAQRIRAELIRLGIEQTWIVAEGRGERELLVPTPDNTAEPRNRRVEVEVR